MNKTKRVALLKHRHQGKKLEAKRKAEKITARPITRGIKKP
ncbi:hypothetical protein ACFLWC_02845 [Chloroflexota bacterium]